MMVDASRSAVLVVDVQPNFMRVIENADEMTRRAMYVAECAHLMGVPVYATEQNPSKMGSLDAVFAPFLSAEPVSKMLFSALTPEVRGYIEGVEQVVVVGVEAHICVTQTCLDLLGLGKSVFAVEDAISARSGSMKQVGLARLASVGVQVAHSDSVVYEWMRAADHAQFREVLGVVKGLSQ